MPMGSPKQALNLISDYFCNRYQRTKVGEKFSTWFELIIGVAQGSILESLFFNIYINNIFLFSQNFNMAVPHMNSVVLSKKTF